LDFRLFYNVLLMIAPPFPWKSIWRNRVPLRAAFFAWTATLGKILAVDNLREHVIVVDWCCMRKRVEFVDHLYLRCEIASALYSAIFTRAVVLG